MVRGWSGSEALSFLEKASWLWVTNGVTPKWLALANGAEGSNLRPNSWWVHFDPHPSGAPVCLSTV